METRKEKTEMRIVKHGFNRRTCNVWMHPKGIVINLFGTAIVVGKGD